MRYVSEVQRRFFGPYPTRAEAHADLRKSERLGAVMHVLEEPRKIDQLRSGAQTLITGVLPSRDELQELRRLQRRNRELEPDNDRLRRQHAEGAKRIDQLEGQVKRLKKEIERLEGREP